MDRPETVLTNEFYSAAIKSQAQVKRYREFLTRSLPALLAYLLGYDEQKGRKVMEAIADNIEGDTDIDTLTRELWDLNIAKNKRTLKEALPKAFPIFLAHYPKTRGAIKVTKSRKRGDNFGWISQNLGFLLSEEAQEVIASYSLENEVVIIWADGTPEIVSYQ